MSPIWYSVLDRYPLRDCLNLSSLVLSAQCCLNSAQLSVLCFLLLLCSIFLSIHGLKPICLMIVRFLFHPFESPIVVRLEFPASVSSPLCKFSQGSGHLSSHELRQLFLKRFGILVTLCNDSSANSVLKSDFRILYVVAYFSLQIWFLIGCNLCH